MAIPAATYAENNGPCGQRDYLRAAWQSASDLRAAIEAMQQPDRRFDQRHDRGRRLRRRLRVAGAGRQCRRRGSPPPSTSPAAAVRAPTMTSATRMRWCAPSPRSAGRRGYRRCGSMRRTTSSSGPNWCAGCTPPLPAPAGGPNSSMSRRSAMTAIRCFRAGYRCGRRWSTAFCATRISERAISPRVPRAVADIATAAITRQGARGICRLSFRESAPGLRRLAERSFRFPHRTPLGA